MLCRCSQQERVIALGVWSSLRRIGSSGQSCQVLPMDSPGCVCVLYCSYVCSCHTAERITVCFHFACACRAHRHAPMHVVHMHKHGYDVHLLTNTRLFALAASSRLAWQLHRTDLLAPWQWQSSPRDLSAPSHMPSGSWNLLDAWAIMLQ